jgi:hypothetical protein
MGTIGKWTRLSPPENFLPKFGKDVKFEPGPEAVLIKEGPTVGMWKGFKTVNLKKQIEKNKKKLSPPKRTTVKVVEGAKRGTCAFKACGKKATSTRARWCAPHRKEVRREQLRLNNVTWNKRKAKGEAKHRLWYDNRPTDYALASPTRLAEAKKLAKKLHPKLSADQIQALISAAKKERTREVPSTKTKAAPKKVSKPKQKASKPVTSKVQKSKPRQTKARVARPVVSEELPAPTHTEVLNGAGTHSLAAVQ